LFLLEKRPFTMQGALASVYGEEAEEGASDAALWLSALDPEEASHPWPTIRSGIDASPSTIPLSVGWK
jgi:hypothetical protein